MNSAIIVAAGRGVRMGVPPGGMDKLFLEIAGRPLVAHTWQRFNDASCVEFVPYSRAYTPGFDDMRRHKPVIEKLARTVGFRPATPLREIILATLKWNNG